MNKLFLSEHFTLQEMIVTSVPLPNVPTEEAIINLTYLCKDCLEEVRKLAGCPLYVNSGFRSEKVNACVSRSINSQHIHGQAADITTGSVVENNKLYDRLKTGHIKFDQLIKEHEGRVLHISYKAPHLGANRLVYWEE